MASKKKSFSVSRRDFIRTVGAGGLATGVLTNVPVGAQGGVRGIGPGEAPIVLTINGRKHQLSVEPRTTLLERCASAST